MGAKNKKKLSKGKGKKVAQDTDAGPSTTLTTTTKNKSGSDEGPSTPPGQIAPPFAGPPVTPEQNALKSLISPKLRGAISAEALQKMTSPVSRTESVDQTSLVQERAAQLADAFVKVKGEQKKIEADLEQVTHAITTLDALWSSGDCELREGDFRREKQRMLLTQQQLMTSVAILRTRGAQLAGRWTDEVALGSREIHDDWAYIDAAIRCYPELANARKSVKTRRNPTVQKRFRQALIRAYNAEDPEKNSDLLWCPIAQMYQVPEGLTAAHVVHVNVGERTAQALFGDGAEHIWDPKNGLLMSKRYEALLDNAKAVILPASNDPNETEFVFHLLTSDIGRGGPVWNDMLHGRKLVFKSDFRPRKRYLYFKFAMGVLRRRRGEVPGYEYDLSNLPSPGKSLWASPGPYMKQSLLYKFSRQLGCMSADEANRFWDIPNAPAPLSASQEDLVGTLASMSCSAIAAEDVEVLHEDKDEDEDGDDEDEDDEDEDEEDEDEEDEDDEDEDDEDE